MVSNIAFRIVSKAVRLLGMSPVFNVKLRALTVVSRAAELARAVGCTPDEVEGATDAAILADRPVATVPEALGRLAQQTVLTAHVCRVDLGSEVAKQLGL